MIVLSYVKNFVNDTMDALKVSDIHDYLKADYAVSIKPNLVNPSPVEDGATTHPEVVEGIILFLKEFGVRKIKIIEGSWAGARTMDAYRKCGYEALSKRYDIPFIDLKSDSHSTLKYGEQEIKICNEALETDFLINVPVLKAHCQTLITCCLKNLKGCIPDSEKRRFHSIGLHKPIAALNMLLKTGYCVVDGICGDLSSEEGGHPVPANRVIAGRDPLEVDSFCAELIGYHPDEIKYLSYANEFGVGKYHGPDTRKVELNAQNKPGFENKSSRSIDKYKRIIDEDAACSACYASLIFALEKLGGKTRTRGKIHIGQGFEGRSGEGIGIGKCTRGFSECVMGCPPKALDIIEALK